MQHFTVYIDEAGDEGIGKLAAGPIGGQSRWLILGGCIVSRENDLKLPSLKRRILDHFHHKRVQDLHFRNFSHEQKTVVCQEMAEFPLGLAIVASHKITIPGTRWESVFKKKGYLYNYLIRWLLERVTPACKRRAQQDGCEIKIVFSRRGGTNYQTMLEYFSLMRYGNEVFPARRRIDWDCINMGQIAVEAHSKWAGLQIADCAVSAFFAGLEPNGYGNYEHSYARILKPRLISAGGQFLNYGLTAVPSIARCSLDRQQAEFFDLFRKDGQVPGP